MIINFGLVPHYTVLFQNCNVIRLNLTNYRSCVCSVVTASRFTFESRARAAAVKSKGFRKEGVWSRGTRFRAHAHLCSSVSRLVVLSLQQELYNNKTKQVLTFLGIKMANFCRLQVRKQLGSYTGAFTVFIDHSRITLRKVSKNIPFYDGDSSCSGEHPKGFRHIPMTSFPNK